MEAYLCCNAVSIAESKYYPEMHPKAIYNNNMLIGFFMYECADYQADTVTLCRFMIDYRFEHKGLGKKAFDYILKDFRNQDVRKIVLMIDETNEITKKLYLSFGFYFTGKIDKDEYYYELELQT